MIYGERIGILNVSLTSILLKTRFYQEIRKRLVFFMQLVADLDNISEGQNKKIFARNLCSIVFRYCYLYDISFRILLQVVFFESKNIDIEILRGFVKNDQR